MREYTITEISKELGVSYPTIRSRLLKSCSKEIYKRGSSWLVSEKGKQWITNDIKKNPIAKNKRPKKNLLKKLKNCKKCGTKVNPLGLYQSYCTACDTWYYGTDEIIYEANGAIQKKT